MDDAMKRMLTCLAAGFALTLSLATKVSAEEIDPTAQDTALPGTVRQTLESATVQAASGEPTETSALSQESGDEPVVMALSEGDGGESDEDTPAAVSLSVGDTALGAEGDDSGWDGNKGWRYDGQSISMVNNETAVDVHAEGQGANLSAAGFNRIGTLYADGDVNITGTGIVLIDNIDLLEGTQLNLLTNTDLYEDGTGSVAVFVKQEDGTYLLVNGSVNGILDDTYNIPKDVHLVIPGDSSLDMRVLDCVKEIREYDDGSVSQRVLHYGVDQSTDYMAIGSEGAVSNEGEIPYIIKTILELSFPKLTIEEGASLTILQDGILNMGTTGYKKADADHLREFTTLTVKGNLELYGKVIGASASYSMGGDSAVEGVASDLIPEILVENAGSVQGSGTFSYVDIRFEGTEPAAAPDPDDPGAAPAKGIHTGDNCRVIVKSNCPTIYAEGKNLKIIYNTGACMGGIVVADREDVSARVYAVATEDRLDLLSEPVDPGHRLQLPESWVYVNGSLYGADAEQAQMGLHPDGWVFDVQVNSYFGGGGFFSALPNDGTHGGKYFFGRIDSITPKESAKFSADAVETISFSELKKVLDPTGELHAAYRVFYLTQTGSDDSGNPSYRVEAAYLDDKSTQSIPREAVFGIEMMEYSLYATVAPATGSISTSKTNTGAGVLGGSNAGSLTGGAYTPILSGGRTNKPAGETPGGGGADNTDDSDLNVPPSTPDVPGGPADDSGTPDDTGDATDTPDEPGDPADEPDTPDETENADDAFSLEIRVTGSGTHFTVRAYLGDDQLQNLGGGSVKVSVNARVPADWNRDDLFAVFRSEDGTITAIKISYDPAAGAFVFDTPFLGDFDIICIHWDGTDYTSDAFRAAVAELLARNG